MARHVKVGLNSGKKPARSDLVGKILSHLPAHNWLGARILRSIVLFSANPATAPTTLGVKVEDRNVFSEDVLYKRMQMLR